MGPHLCINLSGRLLQIFRTFVYNFSWELAGRKNFYTQHCIFSQGYLPVKMASKIVMIRFSALLPISPPFRISTPYECVSLVNKRPYSIIIRVRVRINEVHLPLIAQKQTVMPHYKNSGLMSIWVHKFFKRMISSSNFVAIARLVVLARKDPGTTSPFSSLLDPVTLTCTLFSLRAFLRKRNIRKESSIGTCPTTLLWASR